MNTLKRILLSVVMIMLLTISVNGAIKESLPLPIAGLISNKSMHEVADTLAKLNKIAREELHIPSHIDPFMTLSFLALPVIPEIKLTDMGLFDVNLFDFVDIEIKE